MLHTNVSTLIHTIISTINPILHIEHIISHITQYTLTHQVATYVLYYFTTPINLFIILLNLELIPEINCKLHLNFILLFTT